MCNGMGVAVSIKLHSQKQVVAKMAHGLWSPGLQTYTEEAMPWVGHHQGTKDPWTFTKNAIQTLTQKARSHPRGLIHL